MKTFVTRGESDPFRTTVRFEPETPEEDPWAVTLNIPELYALVINLQARQRELEG